MASIKNLKKDLNYIFSDIIEECYLWQIENKDNEDKAEVVIDAAISAFDSLIEKVNSKTEKGAKKHFQSVLVALESNVNDLRSQIDAL